MAVVNIREVYPGVSLGLWQMDETVEQLFVSSSAGLPLSGGREI